jgi:hypothetical protein
VSTNEQIVHAYVEAVCSFDVDAMSRLRHADWQMLWPQSGERVRGTDNYRRMVESYPGGRPTIDRRRVVGAEDRWVVTGANTVMPVVGSGDFWWSEWRMTYPDGHSYWCVQLLELRDGAVWRETVYWAEPFTAPDWRSRWVEGPPG